MIEVIIGNSYYTEKQCKKVKEKLQGKSFFNFDISYSNNASNCNLIVKSDITGYTPEELKEMFIFCCICELAN